MKPISVFHLRALGHVLGAAIIAIALSSTPAVAAPGAHGPNGEHLDTPAQAIGGSGSVPRFEAQSETFELVGRLQGGELSILINRFASNEPVLHAVVELESGALKATAKFHADMGDYAVDDAPMLKLLSAPGEHPIIVTVLAGQDTDLLDATLKVSGATADAHGPSHANGDTHGSSRLIGLLATLALLAVVAWVFWRKPKAVRTSTNGGAL